MIRLRWRQAPVCSLVGHLIIGGPVTGDREAWWCMSCPLQWDHDPRKVKP